jgi:hypothetical protein
MSNRGYDCSFECISHICLHFCRGIRTLTKLDEQFHEEVRVGAEDVEDYFSVCAELLKTNEEVLSYVRESGD